MIGLFIFSFAKVIPYVLIDPFLMGGRDKRLDKCLLIRTGQVLPIEITSRISEV